MPAHRLVLCLRSPYFRRLFAARATSAGLREVTVSSASGAAFRALLRYLYTGALDASALTRPQLLELFGHAALYEVPGLREACERALAATLALDDALELSPASPTRRRRRRRIGGGGARGGAARRRRRRDGGGGRRARARARGDTDGFRARGVGARGGVAAARRRSTPRRRSADRRMRCAASSPTRCPPTPPPRHSTSPASAATTAASADGRPSRSPSTVALGRGGGAAAHGAQLSIDATHDETMLHAAAAAAERQAVAFLVSHGVAVNARDASHRTPLDVAACRLPPDDGAAASSPVPPPC